MNNAVKAQELLTWDGFPKICVPVVETTQDGITRMAEAVYKSEADIMEWRVDFYKDFHNIEAVNSTISGIRKSLKKSRCFLHSGLHGRVVQRILVIMSILPF